MVMEDSPKRRRAGDHVARSNETLQQHRWMQEHEDVSEPTHVRETLGGTQYRKHMQLESGSTPMTAMRGKDRDTHRLLGIADAAFTVNSARAVDTSREPTAAPSLSTSNIDSSGRARSQLGLPSPTPSEGVTKSPIAHQMTTRVGGQAPSGASPWSWSKQKRDSRANTGAASHAQQPLIPIPRPGYSPHTVGPQHMLRNQQASPLSATPPKLPGMRPIVPGHGSYGSQDPGQSSTALGPRPNSRAQRPTSTQQQLSSAVSLDRLLQRVQQHLDEMLGYLESKSVARLQMLREAVAKKDWFYLSLHQVYCIRSTAPTQLPLLLRSLDNVSWETLDILLCQNSALDSHLVHWFAEFPVPIMAIYSSDAKGTYDKQLQHVVRFLGQLPRGWHAVCKNSASRLAPPLVDDMMLELSLPSPILQTAIFRAAARSFWGPDSNLGSQTLEQLHACDQDSVLRNQWTRTPAQKDLAYRAYAMIYRMWKTYAQISQRPTNFEVPREVWAAFQFGPSNIMSVPVHGMQAQTHQQQLEQHYARMTPASRTPSLTNSTPHQLQQQLRRSQTPKHAANQIFPRDGELPRAQPALPDTLRTGLHQAHLRSPAPVPTEPQPDAEELYRHVIGYRVPQTVIKKEIPVQTVQFTMSEADFACIPSIQPGKFTCDRPIRVLVEQSHTYRLRCCAYPPGGFATEDLWVIADNKWPDNVFFSLNGHSLETRRKLHHGRCLPIDITSFLRRGNNDLTVYVNRESNDKRDFKYVLAVEMIRVTSHSQLVHDVHHISADRCLAAIKNALSDGQASDDDFAVTSNTLTVNLFDPYSSCKIFDTPVRGATCLHKDCFDLETFLGQCKREKPSWPTVVDCWRCPLCKADVRPQSLVVDGWLVKVREDLARKGMLDTRAIVVEADGSWKPKEEGRRVSIRASLEREEKRVSTAARDQAAEVIEID